MRSQTTLEHSHTSPTHVHIQSLLHGSNSVLSEQTCHSTILQHCTRHTRPLHTTTSPSQGADLKENTLDPLHDLTRHLLCSWFTAEIRGKLQSFPKHTIHGPFNAFSTCSISEVTKHECRTADGSDWVGNALSSNVWCGTVYTLCRVNKVNLLLK